MCETNVPLSGVASTAWGRLNPWFPAWAASIVYLVAIGAVAIKGGQQRLGWLQVLLVGKAAVLQHGRAHGASSAWGASVLQSSPATAP